MKRFNFAITAMAALGLSGFITPLAHAEPTLYPQVIESLSEIKNATDSNILADEVDPRTFWVLPPNRAEAKVSGLHTKTANMGFCAEMRDLKDYSRELSADIRALYKQRAAKFEQLTKLQEKAANLSQEAEKYAAEKNLLALSDLDRRITELETRLTDLYQSAESCSTACDQINAEITSVTEAKTGLMRDRAKLARENTADLREYTRRRRLADAAFKAYTDAKGIYTELSTELIAVQEKFRATFQTFGKMEGARAAITYTSHWDENIAKLRAENPGLNFVKVAAKKANLMTEIAGINDVDPQGAILSIGLGGEMKAGVAAFTQYPENLSTNVRLSLIGACPMEHPEYFDISDNEAAQMRYGLIISYEYDSIFKMSAKATYNMYKMYQKIVSSGSSGGLFSSRSWSNVEERNFFRDSFTVTWSDRENTVPQAEKDAREAEMRQSVLSRLATMALPTAPNRAEILTAAAAPARGAVVVSDSLVKVCPTNIYCQAGSAVFRILDAIFGASRTTSSYSHITDVEITESFEHTQKITKAWITSYL